MSYMIHILRDAGWVLGWIVVAIASSWVQDQVRANVYPVFGSPSRLARRSGRRRLRKASESFSSARLCRPRIDDRRWRGR